MKVFVKPDRDHEMTFPSSKCAVIAHLYTIKQAECTQQYPHPYTQATQQP